MELFKSRSLLLMTIVFVLAGCESPSKPVSPAVQDSEKPEVNQNSELAGDDGRQHDQVLRHAVFFKFKKGTSAEQIETINEAFAGLPTKIPQIVGFQWGVNNSPEKLDDGFTHCYLLTFKDQAGRDAYLPHPDHKAFGGMLGPHLGGVFVIDYWGQSSVTEIEKPLKHAVFFKFKDDAAEEQIKKVEAAFAALPSKIAAIKDFEWGVNNSPEKHDEGFTHCFMVTFESEEGLQQYLPHHDHKAFVEVLKPVLDKVRVLDFWAAS